MHRRLIFFIAFLIAVPLMAQTRHLVSRIQVTGDVSEKIVRSQSALAEGRSYGTADLEAAMARLRRLPFVFDARYTIDGETLVIDIDGMRRLFAEAGAFGVGFEHDQSASATLGGGGRLFLGGNGVAEARASHVVGEGEGDDGSFFEAAYSHYGIAGTRLYATAGIGQSIGHGEGYDADPTLRLELGYPLTVRQNLTASFSDAGYRQSRSVEALPRPLTRFGSHTALDVRWTWDSSNDPYFARHGATINAGPSWSENSTQFDIIILGFPEGSVTHDTFRNESTTRSFVADARKFWSTGTRGALFSHVGGDWTRFEVANSAPGFPDQPRFDDTSYGAFVTAGYAHNLFDWDTRGTLRQRIEVSGTYARRAVDQTLFGDSEGTSIGAAYVLRHPLATVKLQLSYAIDGDGIALMPAQPAEPFRR